MNKERIVKELRKLVNETCVDNAKRNLEYSENAFDLDVSYAEGDKVLEGHGIIDMVDKWDMEQNDDIVWSNGYVRGLEAAIRMILSEDK